VSALPSPRREAEVVPTAFDDPVAQELVAALLADLAERYGQEDSAPPPTAADFAPPDGAFVLAWLDGRPVGCGGLRRHEPEVGEIKRMFVGPAARGRGVGRALLTALEDAARAAGYTEVRLETGVEQPEAMALYTSAGYHRIEGFGHYARYPTSRSYAKAL
jgi:GNAT superfamily N-acetyltransferase